jgi:hypothetical protein
MSRDHFVDTIDAITELQSGPTAGHTFACNLEGAFINLLDLWQHDQQAYKRCLSQVSTRYPMLSQASTDVLMGWAEHIAQQYADGHLTVFRFTTGWKAVLRTVRLPDEYWALSAIRQSPTLNEALRDLIGRALIQYPGLRLTGLSESGR